MQSKWFHRYRKNLQICFTADASLGDLKSANWMVEEETKEQEGGEVGGVLNEKVIYFIQLLRRMRAVCLQAKQSYHLNGLIKRCE